MKRLLALTLSLLLVFAVVPMAMTASAEDEYTRVLNNFDDIGRYSDMRVNNTSQGSIQVVDYTTVDSNYTNGNAVKFVCTAAGNPGGFKIDPSWNINTPKVLKFQLWSPEGGSLVVGRTGIAASVGNASLNVYDLGAVSNSDVSSSFKVETEPTWYTYDLSKWNNEILYLVFTNTSTDAAFYIDNVTLVYETETDVPANISEWKTMYNWEVDTTGVTTNGNTITRVTDAAVTAVVPDSTYGLKINGSWNADGRSKYISIAMTEEIKDAADLRVAYSTTVGSNVYTGIEIEGTKYWCKSSNMSGAWDYFSYKTYTTTDGNSSVVLTRDNIKNVTAILYASTATWGSLYVDDIQYANLKASEPEEPAEKDGLTTDAVLTDNKASIRLTDEGGIRFYTTLDEAKITGTVEEIGTLIGPSDLVGTYLTNEDFEAGNAVRIPYLADTFWDGNQFVGSIAKIKTTNYARDFVARGYVKVDGVYYYSTTTATRNVRFVADAYIADPDSGYAELDEATKAIVDKFATPKA